MNYPSAIVIAAALIAGAMVLNSASEARHIRFEAHPRSHIVSDQSGQVWHMHDDQLRRCKVDGSAAAQAVNCSEWQ